MADLYRSRTMSYVRLLIAEESAYDSIRHLGEWGQLQVADLTAANPASQLSERVTRLKKRIGGCQYWEKRLEMLRDVMAAHDVELRAVGDDVRVADVRTADALEAAAAYIDPLDAAVSKNIQFKREQTLNINRMVETMHVLDAVMHPDSRSDKARAQRRRREESEGSVHSSPTTCVCLHKSAAASTRRRWLMCVLCLCCVLPACLRRVVPSCPRQWVRHVWQLLDC